MPMKIGWTYKEDNNGKMLLPNSNKDEYDVKNLDFNELYNGIFSGSGIIPSYGSLFPSYSGTIWPDETFLSNVGRQ